MAATYDKYYQTEHLFGAPYPELIEFLAAYPNRGKLLDLGCGQGRDALALARLGYTVTGLDSSRVGIEQMLHQARQEALPVEGLVGDLYAYDQYAGYEVILLDSMFHFAKKDREREMGLVRKIVQNMPSAALLVVCIQDTGSKVAYLTQALEEGKPLHRLADSQFQYTFVDQDSGHQSVTPYRMIAVTNQAPA